MAITSDIRLQLPSAVLPFIRPADEGSLPDVQIGFTVGEPDLSAAEQIAASVFRKRDLIYQAYPYFNGQSVTRMEDAGNPQQYTVLIPQAAAAAFGQTGMWLNCLGMERILLRRGRIMLHASAVVYNGNALVFSAPSGVGKSTQAELWARYEHTPILNGDKVIISADQAVCTAYGGPIAGTSGIFTDLSAPVSGIVMIRQAHENKIEELTPRKRWMALYAEAIKSTWDQDYNAALLSILHTVSTAVPVISMACLPDESAVRYLQQYLQKGIRK